MNIVNLWQTIIDDFNLNNKCGFCWNFGAPLTESAINISQTDGCCVSVFLTDYNFEVLYENFGSYSDKRYCDHSFNLWVLLPSQLGTNNYNEIRGHDITNSNWQKIFLPLQECFGYSFDLDFCKYAGSKLYITKWRAFKVSNFQDGYSGFRIQITFRQNL